MTDGLEQYHKLARELEGVTGANCMAHARRHFAKAIGKGNEKAIKSSIVYKALVRIGAIYNLEGALSLKRTDSGGTLEGRTAGLNQAIG